MITQCLTPGRDPQGAPAHLPKHYCLAKERKTKEKRETFFFIWPIFAGQKPQNLVRNLQRALPEYAVDALVLREHL